MKKLITSIGVFLSLTAFQPFFASAESLEEDAQSQGYTKFTINPDGQIEDGFDRTFYAKKADCSGENKGNACREKWLLFPETQFFPRTYLAEAPCRENERNSASAADYMQAITLDLIKPNPDSIIVQSPTEGSVQPYKFVGHRGRELVFFQFLDDEKSENNSAVYGPIYPQFLEQIATSSDEETKNAGQGLQKFAESGTISPNICVGLK